MVKKENLTFDQSKISVTITQGAKTPVIISHGNAQNDTSVKAIAAFFRSKGHSVVTFDLPGHGDSEPYKGPFTMDTFVKLIESIINQYCSEKPILVGHSMGAIISLQYATERPETLSSLLIIEGVARDPRKEVTNPPLAEIVKQIIIASRGAFVEQRKFDFSVRAMSEEDILSEGLKYTHPKSLENNFSVFEHFNISRELSKIVVPTYVMWGTNDLLMPKQYIDELVQGIALSRLDIVPDAGHNWFLETPELVATHLQKAYDFIVN